MQLQRSPIALVAEAEGRIIAACCIGIFEDGKPRTNPTWVPCYDEMFAQATEMAKTADAKLEGSLFGDSREKATADRFAATGNEYAQGQLNLIIIVPEWQGKGLGRALIDLARAELARAGCTKFFLMSDCSSDWQFYEHLNMKRILEDHSQDTGDGFIVYMYGGDQKGHAKKGQVYFGRFYLGKRQPPRGSCLPSRQSSSSQNQVSRLFAGGRAHPESPQR